MYENLNPKQLLVDSVGFTPNQMTSTEVFVHALSFCVVMLIEERNPIEIIEAHQPAHLPIVRELFLEYQAALGVDLGFQDFATELETLPGKYAPPEGRLLLAQTDGVVIGCVALRPLTTDTCEMKRLYIRASHRAAGVGRLLVERVMAEARAIGYRHVWLDTLLSMTAAQRLYERLGFRDIAAYRHNPISLLLVNR